MAGSGRSRILLAGPIHQAGRALIDAREDAEYEMLQACTVEELNARLPDLDGVVLRLTPLSADSIALAGRLKVVSRFGVGFDAVDVASLTDRGIPLTITGEANSTTVAEHAIGMMIAASRNFAAFDRAVRASDYSSRTVGGQSDLWAKTVLIVGFGRIGTRVARFCRAFDMEVLVADPHVPRAAVEQQGFRYFSDFREALPEADFVTLHLPGREDRRAMLGAAEFAAMKPGAFLINTARGTLLDEPALAAALTDGHLRGAALDVTRAEPPPPDCPLLNLKSVIFTPHSAALTEECNRRVSVTAVQNLLDGLDGRLDQAMVVNRKVLDRSKSKD